MRPLKPSRHENNELRTDKIQLPQKAKIDPKNLLPKLLKHAALREEGKRDDREAPKHHE